MAACAHSWNLQPAFTSRCTSGKAWQIPRNWNQKKNQKWHVKQPHVVFRPRRARHWFKTINLVISSCFIPLFTSYSEDSVPVAPESPLNKQGKECLPEYAYSESWQVAKRKSKFISFILYVHTQHYYCHTFDVILQMCLGRSGHGMFLLKTIRVTG